MGKRLATFVLMGLVGVIGVVALVAVIAAIPELFSIRLGHIILNPQAILRSIGGYLSRWDPGISFSYFAGATNRSFWVELPPYWRNSFSFLAGGTALGVVLGTLAGIVLSARRSDRLEDYLGSFGVLPDFLVALLLQITVIGITTVTGVRIARVASLGVRPALLLPTISMSLYPAVTAMFTTSSRITEYRSADFVMNALARGIGPGRLYRVHLLPGVLRGIRAELPRLMSIQVATLFIAERVYQSKGIIRWMFTYAFANQGALQMGGYQYGFMLHCLLALVTVVITTYLLVLGVLWLLEKGAVRA